MVSNGRVHQKGAIKRLYDTDFQQVPEGVMLTVEQIKVGGMVLLTKEARTDRLGGGPNECRHG